MTNKYEEYDELTEKIIGCVIKVSNTLGHGFLEKVYENALLIELRAAGLRAEAQVPITVKYMDQNVGDYFADIIVEGKVILELKAVEDLDKSHYRQCINYLAATAYKLCLLINFGSEKAQIKRVVL